MKRYSWCWDDMAEGEDGDYYDCEEVDRRIAELEAEVEKWRRCEAFWRGLADDAKVQRDRLAEALEALHEAARSAIFPESVRMVISGLDWRRLWESIHGAEVALAELEEEVTP